MDNDRQSYTLRFSHILMDYPFQEFYCLTSKEFGLQIDYVKKSVKSKIDISDINAFKINTKE